MPRLREGGDLVTVLDLSHFHVSADQSVVHRCRSNWDRYHPRERNTKSAFREEEKFSYKTKIGYRSSLCISSYAHEYSPRFSLENHTEWLFAPLISLLFFVLSSIQMIIAVHAKPQLGAGTQPQVRKWKYKKRKNQNSRESRLRQRLQIGAHRHLKT